MLRPRVAMLALATLAAWANWTARAEDPGTNAIPSWREIEPGLYSAGQPSPEDWAGVAAAGVRAVVNLRGAGEQAGVDEAALTKAQGLDYYSLPVESADDFSPARVEEFAALLAKLRPAGVLVHCGSGNRVGAMLALAKAREPGVTVEQAIAYGRSGGLTGLEPQIRQRLETGH